MKVTVFTENFKYSSRVTEPCAPTRDEGMEYARRIMKWGHVYEEDDQTICIPAHKIDKIVIDWCAPTLNKKEVEDGND